MTRDLGPPTLLYVDDRPRRLGDAVLARTDVQPLLLRFANAPSVSLPPAYRERTADVAQFTWNCAADPDAELGQLRAYLAALGCRPAALLNPSEPRQHVAHWIGRALGLPALSARQTAWLRDKLRMKARLREIGLRTAESAPVAGPGDVLGFASRHGWPVVVKQVEGFACIGCRRLDGEADLRAWEPDEPGPWMVEEFLPHTEYECCALVHGGEVLDAYVSHFPAPPLAATDGAMNANISTGSVSVRGDAPVRALVERIVRGMALDHGYLHMEYFVAPDGAVLVSEVALRLAGCQIPANHGYACGFDVFQALIDIHLGRRPALAYHADRCVGDLLLPARPGKVVSVTPAAALLALPGVFMVSLAHRQGDVIETRRASHFSSGYVHVAGHSVAEVTDRMRVVLERYAIETAGAGPAPAPTRVPQAVRGPEGTVASQGGIRLRGGTDGR